MKTAVHLSRARGFTALELIIVLIIGFSIIGLSASKMKTMMVSSKTVKALDSILNLANATKSLQSSGGYGTAGADLVANLIKTEVLPQSVKLSGNDLLNEWDNKIEINVGDPNIQQFVIKYPKVPKAACNRLIKELLPNFTTVAIGTAPNAAIDKAATLSDIATLCNNNETDLVLTD